MDQPQRQGRWQGSVDPHAAAGVVYQGYSVLVTDDAGHLEGKGRLGLYDYDTRILSTHHLTVDGLEPEPLVTQQLASHVWSVFLRVPRSGGNAEGPRLPEDALALQLTRRVGQGMEERIVLHNHTMLPEHVELAIALDADFADVLEIAALPHVDAPATTRVIEKQWDEGLRRLTISMLASTDGHSVERGLRVTVAESPVAPSWDGQVLRFGLDLEPRRSRTLVLVYSSLVDGVWRTPAFSADKLVEAGAGRQQLINRWHDQRTRFETADGEPAAPFEQAARDLICLRCWEHDDAPDSWVPNAGVPLHTGLFGKDVLVAGWQSAVLGPEILRGALTRMGATQASDDESYRDEQPGRMVAEMRRGPLSDLGVMPHGAYYGSHTAVALFVLGLAELWNWTGDEAALGRWATSALTALDWVTAHGDTDGDGFLEATSRSPLGRRHQGWKDSDEALRAPDGTALTGAIALAETQAYHYLALCRMAEILLALGEEARAEHLVERARELAKRWDTAYWLNDEGYYALALDRDKRQVRTIASDPAHALAAGIVPPEKAARVARRLFSPDMFSGWGIRSLSSSHPSWNPLAFQLGAVWPVENTIIAWGLKRYGFDREVERLFEGLVDAARCFVGASLPDVLAGYAREQWPTPYIYPQADSPQAWSAGAILQAATVMLGIVPFAPARILMLVRPRLPGWLPELTLRRLRVGNSWLTLRFHRRADGSAEHEVVERSGPLVVLAVPPPHDARPLRSWDDELRGWLLAHAPGRLARQLRLALGRLT